MLFSSRRNELRNKLPFPFLSSSEEVLLSSGDLERVKEIFSHPAPASEGTNNTTQHDKRAFLKSMNNDVNLSRERERVVASCLSPLSLKRFIEETFVCKVQLSSSLFDKHLLKTRRMSFSTTMSMLSVVQRPFVFPLRPTDLSTRHQPTATRQFCNDKQKEKSEEREREREKETNLVDRWNRGEEEEDREEESVVCQCEEMYDIVQVLECDKMEKQLEASEEEEEQ